MAAVGIGVDIVDIDRFATVIARTPGVVTRVFTAREIDECGPDNARSLAVRWAAKEATSKVLVDTAGLRWHDCEVLRGAHGEPQLAVHGTVARAAHARGIESWLVSLSHDGVMAVAFVVGARAST